MSTLALIAPIFGVSTTPRDVPPKDDWPLISDVSTLRAGVPEALIHWRRQQRETKPLPSDPDILRNRFDSSGSSCDG